MSFNVGDRVMRIDSDWGSVRLGEVYTVISVSQDNYDLTLKGVSGNYLVRNFVLYTKLHAALR